jgi:predicted O-methyltransferase YrrM
MKPYIPTIRENPKVVNVLSAWDDIPTILKDIITRFNINPELALEFGVMYGYSTSALAFYFKKVIGIDTFRFDIYDNDQTRPSEYEKVKEILKVCPNITLIEAKYQDIIKNNKDYGKVDLIHIDMIHSYKDTYDPGEWAVRHSDCVIFHDTVSCSAEVVPALADLAKKYNLEFYNYKRSNGLGILVRK